MEPNASMVYATTDVANYFGERVCVTVERDGDLVTGINEDPRVVTVIQIDVTEDADPDMVRLRGDTAATLLDVLMRLVDPHQQRYRKVGPPVSIELDLTEEVADA